VIGCIDLNILIDNNCTDDKPHFGKPGSSSDYEDGGDDSNGHDTIPITTQEQWAATELERIDLGTSDAKVYQGNDGDNVDGYEEEEAWHANNG
jgi:hypothetical protein